MIYDVHFSGYYGYNVKVVANSREEALEKAEYEYVPLEEFAFEPSITEVVHEYKLQSYRYRIRNGIKRIRKEQEDGSDSTSNR